MSKAYAIIPAAGLSTRMGSTTSGQARKQLAEVAGAPILIHTLRRFDQCAALTELLVPVRPEDRQQVAARVEAEGYRHRVQVIEGGRARQDSVANALAELEKLGADDATLVLIHDAVRPFVPGEMIERALEAGSRHDAVIVALPAMDTIKQVERVGADANRVIATLQRERIVLAQTPQVFRLGLLREAFRKAGADGFYGTDEASLVEHLGHDVFVIPGSPRNWKITTPGDLQLAEVFLRQVDASA
ncbi:MAG: 2-C-methyl-D-erythritol 4-phosphate cytidylyltransferase [Rhodanobacteraceae bacterium]